MTLHQDDSSAVIETRVVHDVHRRSTSLLGDAIIRPSAPIEAVTVLRDFVVATLRYHHHSEDTDLWPILTDAAPDLRDELRALSREHGHLDAQLDELQTVAIISDADRAVASERAIAVRDLVHEHLSHEEPILFPALRWHVSARTWDDFPARTVATAPVEGKHLLVAFLDEVGSPPDVELIFRHIPPAAKEMLPVIRADGQATLATLRFNQSSVPPRSARRPADSRR